MIETEISVEERAALRRLAKADAAARDAEMREGLKRRLPRLASKRRREVRPRAERLLEDFERQLAARYEGADDRGELS